MVAVAVDSPRIMFLPWSPSASCLVSNVVKTAKLSMMTITGLA